MQIFVPDIKTIPIFAQKVIPKEFFGLYLIYELISERTDIVNRYLFNG